MRNKLFSILSDNHNYWYVMPLDLMDIWNSVLGFSTITLKKEESYLVATISPSSHAYSRAVSFRVFADKDEEVAEQEAIDWFEKNNLDIDDINNWWLV